MNLVEYFQVQLKQGTSVPIAVSNALHQAQLDDYKTLSTLAKPLGVDRLVFSELGEVDGFVERTIRGLTVTINKASSRKRQRFSLAHEYAHILLGDDTGHRDSSTTHVEHERLCDAIATEILMPAEQFTWQLGNDFISIPLIERLANSFGSSIEATACRAIEISQLPCLIAVWNIKQSSMSHYVALRYARRAKWQSFPFMFKNFVPWRSSSPSCAIDTPETVHRTESLIPSMAPAFVESKRFGSYVLSTIRPLES